MLGIFRVLLLPDFLNVCGFGISAFHRKRNIRRRVSWKTWKRKKKKLSNMAAGVFFCCVFLFYYYFYCSRRETQLELLGDCWHGNAVTVSQYLKLQVLRQRFFGYLSSWECISLVIIIFTLNGWEFNWAFLPTWITQENTSKFQLL